MKVNELVFQMMKENTGRSIFDSGDHFGRNWQRNQEITLEQMEARPAATVETWKDEPATAEDLDVAVSIYHYLKEILELDDLCIEFNTAFPVMEDWDGDRAYGISAAAEDWLMERGATFESAVNTYNHESNLSQILQYTPVQFEYMGGDDFYILLQIHGGCDARGGYTDAKLFKFNPDYDYAYMGYIDPIPAVYVTGEDAAGDQLFNASMRGYYWDTEEDGEMEAGDLEIPAGVVKFFADCYFLG